MEVTLKRNVYEKTIYKMVALLQQGHLRDQFALEESRPEYPLMLIRT